MKRPDSSLREKELLDHLKTKSQLAFSELYDQYASLLLGVITQIVRDEAEAVTLLEETFIRVRSEIDQFNPEKQPLFIWLLQIARSTALAALKKRKLTNSSAPPLTVAHGQVISPVSLTNPSNESAGVPVQSMDFRLNKLVEAVFFKNCTPEEAATSLDIPVELARQQLRLAIQRVRASQKT